MSGATITELVKDKVYCLHNPFPLDGRLSAFPKRVRGWSSANCYVLKEPEGAYMLDTGYFSHQQSVIAQLDQVLDRTTPLTLFPLRITEYMSVGNGLAISRAFNDRECCATLPDALLWLDLEGTSPDRKQPDIVNKVLRGEMRLDPSRVGRRHPQGEPVRRRPGTYHTDITHADYGPIRQRREQQKKQCHALAPRVADLHRTRERGRYPARELARPSSERPL